MNIMKIAIISVSCLLLLGTGGAASYFYLQTMQSTEEEGLEEELAEEEAPPADPLFIRLDPPLVVNFTHRGNLRYLQTSFELMHTEQSVIDTVKLQMPVIRNNLILLLSDQSYEDLNTKSAKEDLRLQVAAAVGDIIKADPPAEIYITNFVMQ